MTIKQPKKISTLGIITTSLFLFSCSGYNPFTRTDTSIQASVINQSSKTITAYAVTHENYSANECTSGGHSVSASVDVTPGQSAQVKSSITCNAKVRSYIYVSLSTNYNIGFVTIYNREIWNKLTLGLQFQVSDWDRTKFLNLQIVPSQPKVGGYDDYWTLAPQGNDQVAWLEKSGDSYSVGILYFSLPTGIRSELDFVEFPEAYGIDKFGNYQITQGNGVYRSRYSSFAGPSMSINGSKIKNESVVCNDIGCRL